MCWNEILLLAALHYNENRDREQAVTESGDKAFTISFPRAKSGDYVVRKRSVAATFEYVDDLMEALVESIESGVRLQEAPQQLPVPPHVSSTFQRPTMEETLARHSTRFASVHPDIPGTSTDS